MGENRNATESADAKTTAENTTRATRRSYSRIVIGASGPDLCEMRCSVPLETDRS
jgi:hypothetical protein